MVTKLNRKSLRAQQARKESGSLRVCSHCPSLCCTQTGERKREKEKRGRGSLAAHGTLDRDDESIDSWPEMSEDSHAEKSS